MWSYDYNYNQLANSTVFLIGQVRIETRFLFVFFDDDISESVLLC